MKPINQIEPLIGEAEKNALNLYLNSGGWLTEYKNTKKFEETIAHFLKSKNALTVCNGTLSLSLALMALNIRKNDEVIVPDFTMIASANAVNLVGSKPKLIDISQSNLCIDIDLIEDNITKKTKAIIVVSLNGRSPKIDKILSIASKYGLKVIEDAAQAFGSKYKGKYIGTFGDIGSFSLSFPKIITTGQGGIVVTDNIKLYEKMRMIKDFGRFQAGVDNHEYMGYNFKYTDLQAIIGIEQMKTIDWRIKKKKEIYQKYFDLLKNVEEIKFIKTNLNDTTPWFIDIIVNNPKQRDDLSLYLKEKMIYTRPFYPSIHTQKPYLNSGTFINSLNVSQRGLWLPSSFNLNIEDIELICHEIKSFFNNN